MDLNKVSLSGRVISKPTVSCLSSKTKTASFKLETLESFLNKKGELSFYKNKIRVEVLGKNAETIHDKISIGEHYCVEGYLRSLSNGELILRAITYHRDLREQYLSLKTLESLLSIAKDYNSLENFLDRIEVERGKVKATLGVVQKKP